ncbi:MAG: hypothetical protein CMF61_06495 [Magnetococcales bacterium]|nr:hypothetical protein [Magnetococcales bacterium]
MQKAKQIILSFPESVDMSLENFMVLPTNHEAYLAVQAFPQTSGDVLVVYGEEGLGKSHILHIHQQRINAQFFDEEWVQGTLELTSEKHVVCDGLDTLNSTDQEKLFHLYNHIKSFGGSLLVTSNKPVAALDILPDLKSRLLTAPQIEIKQPTEAHLEVLLVKMASDKQMFLEPKVIQYIVKNAQRSVSSLRDVLNKLDKLSLEEKRKVTIPLAKQIL